MFWRGRQMWGRLGAAVTAAGLSAPPIGATPEGGSGGAGIGGSSETVVTEAVVTEAVVTEADLAGLPPVTQRYLRGMGVLGRARDWSFRAHFRGRFRLQGRGGWMPAEVWQYDLAPEVARIFHMRLDFARVLPMVGSDTYLAGRGLMHGKLLDLVTVVRSEGPETDLSELVTYLNDLVLLAPSMLLRLPVTFAAVDEESFDVTLSDGGQTVTARVYLDGSGRPRDFATTDRYADFGGSLVRARWTTPIEGWIDTVDDSDPTRRRLLMSGGQVVWHLPEGPLPYLTFSLAPGDVRYNVAPALVGRPPVRRGTAASAPSPG